MRTITRCFILTGAVAILLSALAQTASAVTATGGNATNDIGDYRIHTFTNSATASNFVVMTGGNVEVLVVAGGGGGGGGTGGVIYTASYSVAAGTYNVTVGTGGVGGVTSRRGSNGVNSVFGNLTANGGGGGGNYSVGGGLNGGCGGGGASQLNLTGGTGSQGGNGGNGQPGAPYTAGGGGGVADTPGNGGAGGSGIVIVRYEITLPGTIFTIH